MLKTGRGINAGELPIVEALCEILEDRLIEVEPIENEEILALAVKLGQGVNTCDSGVTNFIFTPNELLIFAQNLIAKVSK